MIPPPAPVSVEEPAPRPPSRLKRVGTSLKHRYRARPRVVDMAMGLAALISYGYYLTGISGWGLLAMIAVWPLLWIWWVRSPGSLTGAVVSLVSFVLVWIAPSWQLGFEYERECFDRKAEAALLVVDEPTRNWTRVEEDGRCGLLSYRRIVAADALIDVYPRQGSVRTVWFSGAGITHFTIFGGHGLVYSPDAKPLCSRQVIGDTHRCTLTSLGDGWYAYDYESNIN